MIEKRQLLTEADSVLCNASSNYRMNQPFFQTSVPVAAASPACNEEGRSMNIKISIANNKYSQIA